MPVESTLTPGDTVLAAGRRIADRSGETPVMTSPEILDELLGAALFFKCEQLQHTGSFKLRGASHAVSCCRMTARAWPRIPPAITARPWPAQLRCAAFAADVVMPECAVASKVDNVRRYGGQVHFCEPTQAGREAGPGRPGRAGVLTAVPPYDDDHIIAGQGTAARWNCSSRCPDLDAIIAPVGGGGLLAGTALAALTRDRHRPQVIAAEPAGADDRDALKLAAGRVEDHRPDTIADGLRALVGERNLAIIAEHVEHVVAVEEDDIIEAMDLLWSRLKQVIEPSGAVSLAGLKKLAGQLPGQRVGVILSGGNLDVAPLLATLR
jgi:threonine dehydratase